MTSQNHHHHIKASLACDITKIIDMMQDTYGDGGMLDMRSPSRNIAFINSILDAVDCTEEHRRTVLSKSKSQQSSKVKPKPKLDDFGAHDCS